MYLAPYTAEQCAAIAKMYRNGYTVESILGVIKSVRPETNLNSVECFVREIDRGKRDATTGLNDPGYKPKTRRKRKKTKQGDKRQWTVRVQLESAAGTKLAFDYPTTDAEALKMISEHINA